MISPPEEMVHLGS